MNTTIDNSDIRDDESPMDDLHTVSNMIKRELQQRSSVPNDSNTANTRHNYTNNIDYTTDTRNGMLISADDLRQLDNGELQDLSRLVWIAEYLSSIHADKEKMRDTVNLLVGTIRSSADSIDMINDDVQQLLLSAKTSLEHLSDAHDNMCRE